MRIQSALELQKHFVELLKKDIREHGSQYGIRAFGAAPKQPQYRIAIGLGRGKRGPHNFRIEVRLQRARGPARKLAEVFKAKAQGEINVVETGNLVAGLARAPRLLLRRMVRPLCLGASIGHIDRPSAGTLGAFVTDEKGQEYLLSCAHVLSAPTDSERKQIIQPGAADIDQTVPGNVVAELKYATEFLGGKLNRADAAVAQIHDDIEHTGNVHPRYGAVGEPPSDLTDFFSSHESEVRKIGKTTGATRGRVSAWNLTNLAVYFDELQQAFNFERVIEIEAAGRTFAAPGDSGALVVSHEGNSALGLIFCGNFGSKPCIIYANPMHEVLGSVAMQLAKR